MKSILFTPSAEEIAEINPSRLIESAGEDNADELSDMLKAAAKIASPKALYAVAPVHAVDAGAVKAGGILIESELVSEKLSGLSRVFPYVCTCGAELESWSAEYASDPLSMYWADEIKKLYLGRVISLFYAYISGHYDIRSHFSQLNPGSLKQWPLQGQRQLFAMIGEDEIYERIGVRLTDSFLMLPSKSVSGIGFESETDYHNCSLCPRSDCPNRRAPMEKK